VLRRVIFLFVACSAIEWTEEAECSIEGRCNVPGTTSLLRSTRDCPGS